MLLLLGLALSLCLTTLSATAAGLLRPAVDFPLPVDSYHDQQIPLLSSCVRQVLQKRIKGAIGFFRGVILTTATGAGEATFQSGRL